MGEDPVSQGITIGADGPTTESVTLEGVDELKTQKVGDNGQIYLGKKYGGKKVMVAVRVEEDDEQTDVSESNDTED